ncbi:MAG TPA: hypothetical protein VD771_00930 [Gemmatimonadaceae bacterium]|nr:hypothetical protein [Gemmatimonadaceae bacterium]
MKLISAICASSAVLLCACVSTNAALIDPTVHLARTCPSAIKLYTTPDKVGRPYREVALLNAKGESNWSDEGDMIDSMRDKAAEVGANGIILSRIDEPSALTKVIGQVAKTGSQRKGNALAIYVPSDSISTTTVCAAVASKK